MYKSKWVLITGASTGIGSEMANILASRGHNIIIVALDDKHLTSKINELKEKYTDQKFIGIPADFANTKVDYVAKIDEILKRNNIDVGIVMNNAGFIRLGPFEDLSIDAHLALVKVNALSYLKISHYFFDKWVKNGRKKAFIGFTCSCTSYFPGPYCVMYGATKSFVRYLATTLSAEGKRHGFDSFCLNPQMISGTGFNFGSTNFIPLKILDKLFPSSSKSVAMDYMKSIGSIYVRDIGWFSYFLKFIQIYFFAFENIIIWIIGKSLSLFPSLKKF